MWEAPAPQEPLQSRITITEERIDNNDNENDGDTTEVEGEIVLHHKAYDHRGNDDAHTLEEGQRAEPDISSMAVPQQEEVLDCNPSPAVEETHGGTARIGIIARRLCSHKGIS